MLTGLVVVIVLVGWSLRSRPDDRIAARREGGRVAVEPAGRAQRGQTASGEAGGAAARRGTVGGGAAGSLAARREEASQARRRAATALAADERARRVLEGLRAASARTDLEQMREVFELANRLYMEQRFHEAHELFLEAHAIKPGAALLYNAGVSLEKAGDPCQALEYFQRYLDDAPEARDRGAVTERIVGLHGACEG
jgi:tetratricopeptide (TPR) repeat protein